MEWLLIAFVLYMICGSMTARSTYTLKQREWLMIAESEESRANRMEEITDDLRTMKHGICNLNYSELKKRGCDCIKQKAWRKYHEELSELQEGGPVRHAPGPQWNTILFWPPIAYRNFITPPVVKGEVLSSYREPLESESKEIGYTVDELSKLMVNPWQHFTREDDTIAKKIKGEWQRVYDTYQSDLKKAQAEGKNVHGAEYGDSFAILGDDGSVVKKYEFDADPILIGVGNTPVVPNGDDSKKASPIRTVKGKR
jgi:hypothetical protein